MFNKKNYQMETMTRTQAWKSITKSFKYWIERGFIDVRADGLDYRKEVQAFIPEFIKLGLIKRVGWNFGKPTYALTK